MSRVNTVTPSPKQLWTHITSGVTLLIVGASPEFCWCRVMDNAKLTKLKVCVPAKKMRNYGNRGFAYDMDRKAPLPVIGVVLDYGTYNPRAIDLGAE